MYASEHFDSSTARHDSEQACIATNRMYMPGNEARWITARTASLRRSIDLDLVGITGKFAQSGSVEPKSVIPM